MKNYKVMKVEIFLLIKFCEDNGIVGVWSTILFLGNSCIPSTLTNL